VIDGEVLGAFADDDNELGLVIKGLGNFWTDDRLPVRYQRRVGAHENGRKFRDVIALGAFLHVLEVVQSEADDFPRLSYRQTEFQPGKRSARADRSPLGRVFNTRKIPVRSA